jgi:hypothetical protein
MQMTLNNWLENRWVTEHTPSREEVTDLLAVVDRDLEDAAITGLSADWRLGIAYNAALQLSILALAAEGYRAERQRMHERAIQSLRNTIGLDQSTIDALDVIRRKRHQSNYERAGTAPKSRALPDGAAADFRVFAAREGLPVPAGTEADERLRVALLPLLAEAKWGAAGLYRISAVLDGEVERARATFAQAGAILGR